LLNGHLRLIDQGISGDLGMRDDGAASAAAEAPGEMLGNTLHGRAKG
jgi:hypothetical protein